MVPPGNIGILACAGKHVTVRKHIVSPQAGMPALLNLTVTETLHQSTYLQKS